MAGDKKIRVGSRKSELALIQTKHVITLLKELNPDKEFEIVTMSTLGDQILDIPLPKIGEKSLFTKELETALTTGCVDFLVHSLKDLPTSLPPGMAIGAVLCREDPRDALVLQKDLQNCQLSKLPAGSTIGTSSLRRAAQLARKYPDLKVENIRGNLNTRLRKLDELGQFQGIILAAAGLVRMGWDSRISQILESDELLYAVGQGALAVECRESDLETLELLRPLYDAQSAIRVLAERSFLRTLGGGCSAPVAVCTTLKKLSNKNVEIKLIGAVWSLDGKEELLDDLTTEIEVREKGRCKVCPYGFKVERISTNGSCTKNNCSQDIECLKECSFKTQNRVTGSKYSSEIENEVDNKRLRLDKTDVPVDLLKSDPHEHCPVEIPVGLDFMGKCPYLESSLKISNEAAKHTGDLDISKCPFFRDFKVPAMTNGASSSKAPGFCPYKEPRLYCGLVSHLDIPHESFEKVQKLGEQLAENLMKEGATEVMAKAQAHIRGGV